MQDFFIRLDTYLNLYDINDNRVTIDCGISNGLIGKARKRGSLSQENISKILNLYKNLDANWLMTGKGEMLIPEVDSDVKFLSIIKIENIKKFQKPKNLSGSKNNKFIASNLGSAEFLVEVNGRNTSQKYSNGDFLACRKLDFKDAFFQWNNVFILDTKLGIWIKKLMKGKDENHLLILSDNPNHDPFEIRVSEINAIALVLGVIKLD